MRLIIILALAITATVAAVFAAKRPTCEEAGGHYEYLHAVDGSVETKVCVPGDEVDFSVEDI